jgi:site-specific DNA recombinase
MRAAVYARVSTTRQAQTQTIEQQLDRLRLAVTGRGWELEAQHIYRDDGYSGAGLGRPGLDRLRDHAALADLDVVLVTAPDRLARNYVHQVLLIEELAGHGCQVEFLDRPMSDDPHDQLLLQIRGAVAEYERTLITERMRRGRHARLRAGTLLPWTRPPFGYRLDPDRPRDAAAVRVEPGEAALVAQLFDWYLEPQATLYQLTTRLADLGVATPTGKPRWTVASVRGILRNPSYAGRALTNRTRVAPARRRRSALLPAGPGESHAPRPEEDWIEVPVPQVVGEETFAQVQAKLNANQQGAARNTRHEYLLRALVSCGACRLACTGRQTGAGYRYYLCRGRTDALRAAEGRRCTARYIPAGQLDELVWADLCALLTDPGQVTHALARAQTGAWLPQELQARQATIGQALGRLERQQQRLLDAYLAEALGLPELQRKGQELDRRHATLLAQQRQLDAAARQRLELQTVADGIERFCQAIRAGLAAATFTQRRQLAELLIDRVIVTDDQVEIRYVLPTSPDGPHRPFCQLRKDHLDPVPDPVDPGDLGQARGRVRAVCLTRPPGAGQVGDQVPGGLFRQGARVGGGHHDPPGAVRPPPAQPRVGRVPGLGVPVPEGPGHRLPVAGIGGPVPGQGPGRVHRGMGIGAVGPGAAAGPQRHHERQPGLGQLTAEPVLIPVRAIRRDCAEHEPRRPGPDRQIRADRQLGPERRVVLALREVPGRRVWHRMHRVIQPLVSPQCGDGDHPVVGLAVPAQPLMAHVRGLGAVLAVPAVVNHQHPAAVRRGHPVRRQQLQPAGVDLLWIPPGLRQEELQPLHRRMLRPGHRLRPSQCGQRLVPVPRRQQPGQILPEPAPLRQPAEQVIKPGRVLLQRARRHWTGPTSRHRTSRSWSNHYSQAYTDTHPPVNKLPLADQRP